MDSLCSLLLPKNESSAGAPTVSLADAMEDMERKKMYSNFQDYLNARKEAKKKELYWFSAGFFLFFELCISVFLFFALENSWEVRMVCLSVPAPVLCMFGMALKKRGLWWPQLVLNVVFAALSDLALVVTIVLVITKPSSYWLDGYRDDYRPRVLTMIIMLCAASHYIEGVTRKAYAQVADRKKTATTQIQSKTVPDASMA